MTCIWHDYGKEMEKRQKGIIKTLSFRYPPILPIVYYEGTDKWSASMQLSDRIQLSELLGDYMPNFTYELISNHSYSNEELLSRGNEMSIIMMLNKMQTADDIGKLRQLPPKQLAQLDKVLKHAPDHLKETIQNVMYALMMKMNVPVEEASEHIKLMGEKRMGYLFENFKTFDIQEERRKSAEAQANLDKANAEADKLKAEVDKLKADIDKAKAEAQSTIRQLTESQKEIDALKKELAALRNHCNAQS